MTGHEVEIIQDAEVIGTEIEPVQHGTLFRTDEPAEIVRRATELADELSRMLRDRNLVVRIGNGEHVKVEGWTFCGTMLGVFPVCEWTRPLEGGGWEARVVAKTLGGQEVGAAEAQCSRSEKEWGPNPSKGKMRDDYALRSMAQTRATSKALRQPLGFVISLAGFNPTPAEEMPLDGGHPQQTQVKSGPAPLAPPKSWAKLTEMVSAYDEATHDLFFAFADSARRLLFPESVDTKSLPKRDKDVLFQTCAGAAVHLREMADPNTLPPPTIEDIRRSFALVMDGQELAIPDEALDDEAVDAAERDA